MKKTNLLFAAAILGAFLNISFAQDSQEAGQNQETLGIDSSRIWDFGEVKEGSMVEHTFTLINDSDENLNIEKIDTSCGCTVSETTKKTIAPQEKTEIKVTFKSKGYSGKVRQFVFVNTDNLDKPVIQFVITADVK